MRVPETISPDQTTSEAQHPVICSAGRVPPALDEAPLAALKFWPETGRCTEAGAQDTRRQAAPRPPTPPRCSPGPAPAAVLPKQPPRGLIYPTAQLPPGRRRTSPEGTGHGHWLRLLGGPLPAAGVQIQQIQGVPPKNVHTHCSSSTLKMKCTLIR